jgi:hypothetical protein
VKDSNEAVKMSSQRVDKIEPISATSPSAPVHVGQTHSIFSDPDSRWIAERQSAINTAFAQRPMDRGSTDGDTDAFGASHDRMKDVNQPGSADDRPPRSLSGESERIGKGDWSAMTPFGMHVGYV